MAGKQLTGDGLPLNFAGMSKNQLYEIMSQMKSLIEQNQDQAKEILIQNPLLTKALFQAQIMLGMVQPPQMIPKVEPLASQPPQLSVQPRQQPSSQPPQFSSQASFQDQTRKQPQNQQNMSLPIASTTIPAISTQPPSVASHSLQPPQPQMLHQNLSSTLPAIPQSSQLPNIPPVSLHSSTKVPPLQQPQMPPVSGQLQQPNPSSGGVPLQPPLQPPLQLRPPSMQQPYHHQYPPQIGPGGGFSHSGGPQHGSQPMYHTAPRPAPSTGSFPQGQPPPPTQQQLPQPMYQVGGASHSGSAEFSHHPGGPVPGDRGSSWIPGLSEPTHLPGPPPVATPSQAGPTSHPSQPPSLSPEMEKALLQQVISLTQEQINLLPPEQRSQVLQLQQMLRQ